VRKKGIGVEEIMIIMNNLIVTLIIMRKHIKDIAIGFDMEISK